MGVISEQTTRAIRELEEALETLERYPADVSYADRMKLPMIAQRFHRLQYHVFQLSEPRGDF